MALWDASRPLDEPPGELDKEGTDRRSLVRSLGCDVKANLLKKDILLRILRSCHVVLSPSFFGIQQLDEWVLLPLMVKHVDQWKANFIIQTARAMAPHRIFRY